MKYIPSILSGLIIALGFGAFVAHAQTYTPLEALPGTLTQGASTTTMGDYLSGAIKLLIAIGAAVSIFVAVVGGTQYVASGISPDAKNAAKERITNAFVGLALIISSYLILSSISPNLVQFNLNLAQITPASLTIPVDPYASQLGASSCPTNTSIPCVACSGCSSIPASVPTKTSGLGACTGGQCFLNSALLAKIENINIPVWYVTEAWPPTVKHADACHANGTCADLNNTNGLTDPTNIKMFYDAFKKAGLNVLYESNNCAPYIAAGITNCGNYPTMTNGSSFHVRL